MCLLPCCPLQWGGTSPTHLQSYSSFLFHIPWHLLCQDAYKIFDNRQRRLAHWSVLFPCRSLSVSIGCLMLEFCALWRRGCLFILHLYSTCMMERWSMGPRHHEDTKNKRPCCLRPPAALCMCILTVGCNGHPADGAFTAAVL